MSKKELIISCFNWYKARLKPIRELGINRGFEVSVLIADFDHISRSPIEERYPACTYIKVPKYKKNISIQRIVSHLSFGKSVGKYLRSYKPDVVYCQIPPNNVGKECMRYKKKHPDTTLILDIIDLWPESMPLRKLKNTPLTKTWSGWRNRAISCADHVFTECDLYQEKLRDVIKPERTSTLYLYKDQSSEEKALVQEIISKGKKDDTIRFAYLGSMNIIIDIEGICNVLKQFTESGFCCELHAIGDGESRDQFEAAIKETGIEAYFYGPVFDEMKKIEILAPCDYAFNMMKQEVEVGLTTKSIDYFSCGLPVINNIKGDTWALVERERCGVNIREGVEPDWSGVLSHSEVWAFFKREFSIRSFLDIVQAALDQSGV